MSASPTSLTHAPSVGGHRARGMHAVRPPRARRGAAIALAAIVLAAVACRGGADRWDADAAATRRLVGAWDARFRSAEPPIGAPRGARPADVHGVLAFVPNPGLDGLMDIDAPTDVGTFDVVFTPLGFDLRSAGQVPAAVARAVRGDSVELRLGSGSGQPAVWMRGAWAGDSIVGTWSLASARAAGGSGAFVLARHRAR